jgi:glycosyltransferase involved in cell wall biosynthesis
VKLHFIQNEATPHNNALIRELFETEELELVLWYAREESNKYKWMTNPTHEILPANIYGDSHINWDLVFRLVTHRAEKVFQTGWGNPTTRMNVFLFWLTRRSYNLWFDYPQDQVERSLVKKWLRELFYYILKRSKVNVFCVGKMVVEYFAERGFPRKRLINLPVLVDATRNKEDYAHHRNRIRSKYCVGESDLFLVAGSRLTKDKGYDLLIQALTILPTEKQKYVKTLIIGKGKEKENLLRQISEVGFSNYIFIEEWMDVDEYRACISNADVFIHPARFDAYGGGTLNAMSLGVPVIASYQSGSGPDRIDNGVSGWLYDSKDVATLSALIEDFYNDSSSLKDMGKKARETSQTWSSDRVVKILRENVV